MIFRYLRIIMTGKLYNGAGNRFLMYDGRRASLEDLDIVNLCKVFSTDGLIILRNAEDCDFEMEFHNPDGSGGMMCGNGGRCAVAFAQDIGVIKTSCSFRAADGIHKASILKGTNMDAAKIVSLSMGDVTSVHPVLNGFFLDTGTRHLVIFVDDVDAVDILTDGPRLRHDSIFAPQGTNVNFVQNCGNGLLKVRTFEKGVEGETLACGTGITASAIAANYMGIASYIPKTNASERIIYNIIARRGDSLQVSFVRKEYSYVDVILTGPTEKM